MVGNVSDLAVGRTAGGMICKERFEDAGTVGVLAVAAVVCVVVVVCETPTGAVEAGRQIISL